MDDKTALPSPRSKILWHEAPNIHVGFNTYWCQTIVIEDARLAISAPLVTVESSQTNQRP